MNATKTNATSTTSFNETERKDSAKNVQQPVANGELNLKERQETVEKKLKEGEVKREAFQVLCCCYVCNGSFDYQNDWFVDE